MHVEPSADLSPVQIGIGAPPEFDDDPRPRKEPQVPNEPEDLLPLPESRPSLLRTYPLFSLPAGRSQNTKMRRAPRTNIEHQTYRRTRWRSRKRGVGLPEELSLIQGSAEGAEDDGEAWAATEPHGSKRTAPFTLAVDG